MKFTIFYSWQSDLPNSTNRGFINSVIEQGAKLISDKNFEIELAVDRDTKDIPGSPDIDKTIFEKINQCDVFVADISIINTDAGPKFKKTPNPNVLLELGYAMALLGTEKIILFYNEATGTKDDVPFDLSQKRRIKYHLKEGEDKTELKKIKSKEFSSRVEQIISNPSTHKKRPLLRAELIQKFVADGSTTLKMLDPDNLNKEIISDMKEVTTLDGSKDPHWVDKLSRYKEEVEQYSADLRENYIAHYIRSYEGQLCIFNLKVINTGSIPATNVKVDIYENEDVMFFEKFEHIEVKTKKPVKPKIEVPKSAISELLRAQHISYPDRSFQHLYRDKSNACYVDDDKVHFWSDKILHKHEVMQDQDSFLMIPTINCNKSKVQVKVSLFCEEYEDWEEQIIEVEVEHE